jgi:hypothetical protein
MDHNHLRITRIIRSLRILGLEAEALALYTTLSTLAKHASESSHGFWKRAALRSLNIPPDDTRSNDDNRTVGKAFLIKYEESRESDGSAIKEAADTEAADKEAGSGSSEDTSQHAVTKVTEEQSDDNRPVKRSRKM